MKSNKYVNDAIYVQCANAVSSVGKSPLEIFSGVEVALQVPQQLDCLVNSSFSNVPSPCYGLPCYLPATHNFSARIRYLVTSILLQLEQGTHAENTPLWIQLPNHKLPRSMHINAEIVQALLMDSKLGLEERMMTVISDEDAFIRASEYLMEDDTIEQLMFMSIDCLFLQESAQGLAQQGKLMTLENSDGIALGEAAVYLLLSKTQKGSLLKIEKQSLNCGDMAFVDSFKQTCQHNNADIRCMLFLHDNPEDLIDKQYQLEQQFFNEAFLSLPDMEKVQAINFSKRTGDTGVSSLPLAIVYAAGRFQYPKTAKGKICLVQLKEQSFARTMLLRS